MYTKFRSKIYSVGDGFCYEGIIKSENKDDYHFIVDCGSCAPKKRGQKKGKLINKKECDDRLNEITDEVAHNNSHINLFILTHLHEDHLNGYEILFNKTQIDTIIMPYIYPEERLCLMIDDDVKDDDYVFLSRPYSEVLRLAREYNPEVRLVLIRGNNDSLDQVTINVPDSNNNVWGEGYADSENILEIEGLENSYVEIVSVNSKGINISDFLWFFKLFNLEADENDVNNLKTIIGKLDAKKLYNIVIDPIALANTKNKYKNIAKYYRNDINNTSIVIYHSPIDCHSRCGSLLTGDIVLKRHNIASEILNYYKNEIEKVGFFSIPHHGSDDNWTKTFIDNGCLDNSVCFASTHNYYSNRMTATMMSDLRCHNISTLVVDENRFSEIEQVICDLCYHHIFCESQNKYKKVIVL